MDSISVNDLKSSGAAPFIYLTFLRDHGCHSVPILVLFILPPQLIIFIASRHQHTVPRAFLNEAGGFFLGADHHPKTDTNSAPELASGCRRVKKCSIAVTPNQATQNIKGSSGLSWELRQALAAYAQLRTRPRAGNCYLIFIEQKDNRLKSEGTIHCGSQD